jgi:hypothetical protein
MQIAGQAMKDLVASCNDVVVLHRSSYILQPRLNLMRQTLTILDDIVLLRCGIARHTRDQEKLAP